MDTLFQYGTSNEGNGWYYRFIERNQFSLRADFGDVIIPTTKIAGLDGAWYIASKARAFSSIGNVQSFFWILDDDKAEVAKQRNAVLAMLDYGASKLFKRTLDNKIMWTWAVVNNISMPQSVEAYTHTRQRVQINFQAVKPFWFTKPDDVLTEAGAYTEGAIRKDYTSVTNGSSFTVTNNGNSLAYAVVRWRSPVGVTMTNPTISRDNLEGTVNSLQYVGAITNATGVVRIDAGSYTLDVNGSANQTLNKISAVTAEWLTIPAGTSTLNISGTFSGGNGEVSVDFFDCYR